MNPQAFFIFIIVWQFGLRCLQVNLREECHLAEHDDLLGLLALVCTEDEDSLALPEERIEVENADTRIRYFLDSFRRPSWDIVDAEGKDIGELHVDASLLKNEVCLRWRITQDTVYAIILGVCHCGGNNLYACLAEKVEDTDECASFVLNKDG